MGGLVTVKDDYRAINARLPRQREPPKWSEN